ncbi:MAG: response regulator transcription factor [Planctomycetaceae bacterium]|nr:response regulator transcription factor [Planctomycetaceae bacterium]
MKSRILIVEDERHIGVLIKFNCEAEGYEATLVEDGPSALELFEHQPEPFDLVILDLMLPQMSGYAVLEKLRSNAIYVPVLILTARTLSEDRIRGFDVGADQYMTKPFELPELLARVRSLIARHAQVKGSGRPTLARTLDEAYAFGDATVNFARHEVSVRGEPRSLTSLEIKLLKYLVDNEGVVLTRNQLLDNVWGVDSSPTTRTVDNFIARLRQHFETDPANPRHFLSVRGVGYRFVEKPVSHTEADVDAADGDSATTM